MPNIKSAIKRLRQNEKRRSINRRNRSILRTQIKRFRKHIEEGDIDSAKAIFEETCGIIDKSRKRGIIKDNNAARTKSRLSAALLRASS